MSDTLLYVCCCLGLCGTPLGGRHVGLPAPNVQRYDMLRAVQFAVLFYPDCGFGDSVSFASVIPTVLERSAPVNTDRTGAVCSSKYRPCWSGLFQ
jgi:hypothetical protein